MNDIEFEKMVNTLLKPGGDILASLTAEKVNLLHNTIGLVGEVGELVAATDETNIEEELGDIEFYYTGLYSAIVLENYLLVDTNTITRPKSMILRSMTIISTDILDNVKKHVVYNKPLDERKLVEQLGEFRKQLIYFYTCVGITRQQAIDACAAKLAVRYKNGYTDQAAQDRADKEEGQ